MKIRNGFVSNSSSSSFIIDTRIAGANEYLERARKEIHYNHLDLGRYSSVCDADEIRRYLSQDFAYHREFIKKGIDILGDAAAFVRISDENMGGWYVRPDDEIIILEGEWH